MMKFPLLERLKEINADLGPVFKEMGLQARIGRAGRGTTLAEGERKEEGPPIIGFQSADGTAFSPVEIIFGGQLSGDAISYDWESSALEIHHWEKQDLGDNGWTYFYSFNESHRESFAREGEELFATLKAKLVENGVVLRGDDLERRTTNRSFAMAHDEIVEVLESLGEPPLICERHGGIESYNFEYPSGTPWRIAFEGDNAVLYVEGDKKSACSAMQAPAIGRLLRYAKAKFCGGRGFTS